MRPDQIKNSSLLRDYMPMYKINSRENRTITGSLVCRWLLFGGLWLGSIASALAATVNMVSNVSGAPTAVAFTPYTYTFSIANNGPSAATNPIFSATLQNMFNVTVSGVTSSGGQAVLQQELLRPRARVSTLWCLVCPMAVLVRLRLPVNSRSSRFHK